MNTMNEALKYAHVRGALKYWIAVGEPVDTAKLQSILEDAERRY